MNSSMNEPAENMEDGGSSQWRFCALDYRPQSGSTGSLVTPSPILLVLRDEEGNLRFLVHTELPAIVQGEDWVYLQSLLRDFEERAKLDPASLFKQLSTLRVGPLVTRVVGADLNEYPEIQALSSAFVEL